MKAVLFLFGADLLNYSHFPYVTKVTSLQINAGYVSRIPFIVIDETERSRNLLYYVLTGLKSSIKWYSQMMHSSGFILRKQASMLYPPNLICSNAKKISL